MGGRVQKILFVSDENLPPDIFRADDGTLESVESYNR